MKPPLIYKLLQENPAAASNPLKPPQPLSTPLNTSTPYTMKSPLPPHLLPTQQIFSFLSFLCLLLLFSLLLIPSSLKAQNSASYSYQKDYHYDPLGRLSQVQYQSQYQAPQQASEQTTELRTRKPELYRYDAVGNLTYKQIQGEDYHYHYDSAHQLVRMDSPRGSHQYHYDQAGRLIEEEVNGQTQARYQYGYQDKVIAVERDGAITRYEYDAQGNLIAKIDPDGQYELWIWDGITLLARGDERYINQPHASGGLPIVSKTARGIRYHRHDPLGTTLADYDLDGNRVHIYEYTIYGEGQRAGELESSPSARFTGKPYDVTLAAYVFPYRNYDPITVRWRSSDPIGFPDGPNNHYYAAIPTMQIDPWGLEILDTVKIGSLSFPMQISDDISMSFNETFDASLNVTGKISWSNANFRSVELTGSTLKTGFIHNDLITYQKTSAIYISNQGLDGLITQKVKTYEKKGYIEKTWSIPWYANVKFSVNITAAAIAGRGNTREFLKEYSGTVTKTLKRYLEP